MKTILVVAGTRPEIIKVAPLVLSARESFEERLQIKFCATGQHQSMAEEALAIFGITPDVGLEIMRPNQTLNHIAKVVFERLPPVLDSVKPDVVLIQGDTTTAAVSALCAFNMKIPVGHVEAGLRSFDLDAPYPEECNRKLIGCFATYNFCPTESARNNLRNEAVPEEKIYLTGNTIVDAIHRITMNHSLDDLTAIHPLLRQPFVLITAHRRESFGQGFEDLCAAIKECALKHQDVQFVYPVHLNPNVRGPVERILNGLPNLLLLPPVSYLKLLTLQKHCLFILTDSGGIQEEAPSFGKYCIVLRDRTERMESVAMGMSELVGVNKAKIVAAVERMMNERNRSFDTGNPYGDGKASERILEILAH